MGTESVLFLASFLTLVFLWVLYTVSTVEFACGTGISRYNVALSAIVTTGVAVWLRRPAALRGLVLAALFFAAAAALCHFVIDIDHDSNRYHAAATLALLEGDNPLRGPYALDWIDDRHGVWLRLYPKLVWVLGANFAAQFGSIEVAKVYNFLGWFVSLGFIDAALFRLGWRKPGRWIAAFLLASSPIATTTLFGLLQDGLLASLLASLVSALVILQLRPSPVPLLSVCFLSILAVNVKTPAIGFVCVLLGAYGVWHLNFIREWKRCAVLGLAAAVGFLGYGAEPFAANLVKHGNPFFGIVGPGKIHVIDSELPESMRGMNSLEAFAISLFSQTERVPDGPALKLPFTFSVREFRELSSASRFGALGPLFSGLLLVSLATTLVVCIRRKTWRLPTAFAFATLLATVLPHPAAWWLRYVPLLFFIGTLGLVLLNLAPAKTRTERILLAANWTLVVLVVLSPAYHLVRTIELGRRAGRELAELQELSRRGRVTVVASESYSLKNIYLLRERGAKFELDRSPAGEPDGRGHLLADVFFRWEPAL